MGAIAEVITGRATNPAALTALTMNTGDTAAVRSFGESPRAMLLNAWAQEATTGFLRVRSPNLHDNTQGLRLAVPAALPQALLPDGVRQNLIPTDVLTLEIQGGAAEVDAAAFLMYYDNIGTGAARLATWAQIAGLIESILSVQVDTAGPVASGDWSNGTVFTNFSNVLHANTFYAVLGYEVDVACCAVALRGPDTGNYRIGGPGPLVPIETRDWFKRQSSEQGLPFIPIINSQNAPGTTSNVAKVGAAGTVNVTWILAELSANPGV
jgi:hypothetical protein